MCKSHVELALETQNMSSGERRGEVEIEKEGREKLFERAATPLLCSGIQKKEKMCYIVLWKLLVSRCMA